MKTSQTTALAAALVGAAGGALAIYLLDPQAGQGRRERIGKAAGEALEGARHGLETLASNARDHARRVGEIAGDAAGQIAKPQAAELAAASAAIAAQAHGLGKRLFNHVHRAADPWLDRGERAAAALRGEKPSSRVLPLAVTAAGFCAAGVGLMWLLDPDRGRRRRAMLQQRVTHVLHKTGRRFNSTGRHLRNKMRGYAARTQRTIHQAASHARSAAVMD